MISQLSAACMTTTQDRPRAELDMNENWIEAEFAAHEMASGAETVREEGNIAGRHHNVRRRTVLKVLGALGIGTATFRRALAAQVADASKVTPEMIKQAEWIAGLELTDKERESAAKEVQESLGSFAALRKVEVGYDVPPALSFHPSPSLSPALGVKRNQATTLESHARKMPGLDEDLAFL